MDNQFPLNPTPVLFRPQKIGCVTGSPWFLVIPYDCIRTPNASCMPCYDIQKPKVIRKASSRIMLTRCYASIETVVHALRDCPLAKEELSAVPACVLGTVLEWFNAALTDLVVANAAMLQTDFCSVSQCSGAATAVDGNTVNLVSTSAEDGHGPWSDHQTKLVRSCVWLHHGIHARTH
ncbi:hypothetical protein V6N11_065919 [Hibiscus sabdariffa]|uniref:Uncharacterized protein n=1 Tax=Hibiscus sabdariffa TaxID=183260 RepID=A0ABR2PIQ4_9ROSI